MLQVNLAWAQNSNCGEWSLQGSLTGAVTSAKNIQGEAEVDEKWGWGTCLTKEMCKHHGL